MINQFKTFRIGTDLTVNFHFLNQATAQPVDVSNFQRELSFTTGRGRSIIQTTSLRVAGDTITWFFEASEQALTGDYYVTVMMRTPDGTPALTQDFRAFRLSMFGESESAVIDLYAYIDTGESSAVIPEISDETGNWVINGVDTGKKATFPLYDTTGYHTEGPMSQKAVTDKFNALELANCTITFTASPSAIYEGQSISVALFASVSGLPNGADLIEILDQYNQVVASMTGNTVAASVTLTAAATYKARVTLGSSTKTETRSIPVVGHIYYGSGTTKADFVDNRVEYPNPASSVARTYTVNVRNEGDYVFFQIPSSMTINNVMMGGFSFPITLQETADGMKLYRSDNTYLAGNLTLVVS